MPHHRSPAAPGWENCRHTAEGGCATSPVLVAALVVLGILSPRVAADVTDRVPASQPVRRTFNNAPFRYRMKLLREEDAYRVYRLTYPSPMVTPVKQNNTIPADYYLPRDMELGKPAPKRPAVICLHILDGNFELVGMLCSALASRGVPAVAFKLPYYGQRALPGGPAAMLNDPKRFLSALPQAGLDVRRTVDLLASRPEIDPERIGIAGISLGGLVAATAAADEERIHRVALILAGGDLPYIIRHAREARAIRLFLDNLPPAEKVEVRRMLREVDPLSRAAGLRDRARRGRVLMINGTEDRVIPRVCTEKLADALGIRERVVWLDGLGHYTAMAALPRIMETTVDFFARDLPPGVKPPSPVASDRSPARVVVALLQQIVALGAEEPAKGRCHLVDIELSAKWNGGGAIDGRLQFIRGSHKRFKLAVELKHPRQVSVTAGQGTYPWMASGGKIVFKGTGEPADELADPLALADEQHLMKLRMIAGAVAGVALTPNLLDRFMTLDDDTSDGRAPAIRITLKDEHSMRNAAAPRSAGKRQRKPLGRLRLVFHNDKKTPRELTFDVAGVRGTIIFHAWRTNTLARAAMFEPPDGLPGKEVNQADMYRIFSSAFNFAMEQVW